MTGPIDGDFLYVMQNSAGLIKVGRSTNPQARRRALECQSGMKVALLLSIPERGRDERNVLGEMWQHSLVGEWFAGTQAAKAALRAILAGHEIRFVYPIRKKSIRVPIPLVKKNGKKRAIRVVKHRLANGSTKTYKYGPYPYKCVKNQLDD